MKALAYHQYGPAKSASVVDLPEPLLESGQVLIKVEYAGINPVDWKIGEGRLQKHYARSFPLITGRDLCGTVEKIGAAVKRFSVGDVVFACLPGPGGAFAEYVAVDEGVAALAPTTYSSAESASIPLAGLTCWQALVENAKLTDGDVVFVLSGAGGTGSIAVQIAAVTGAKVIATCSPVNSDYVLSLGASKVYDYSDPSLTSAILKDHPSGVDVVFSNVLGTLHRDSYQVLRSGGTLVTIGEAPIPELAKQREISEVDMVVRADGHQLSRIARLMESQALSPPAVTSFNLADGVQALEMSQGGHTRGKIVLRMG